MKTVAEMLVDGDEQAKLLKINEVARVLGCTTQTLRNWVKIGKFPQPDIKIGHSQWTKKSVMDFVENHD